MQEGCSESCLLSLVTLAISCYPAAPRCRLLLVISAGLAFVFCLSHFPGSNSITRMAPVSHFSPRFTAVGAAEGAGLVMGLPDALPIPLLRPCPAPAPLQTWGISPSCSFGLCHLPCTAVSSNKEYKDSRALRTYFL